MLFSRSFLVGEYSTPGPSGDPVLQCSFCELHYPYLIGLFWSTPYIRSYSGGGKSLAERFSREPDVP